VVSQIGRLFVILRETTNMRNIAFALALLTFASCSKGPGSNPTKDITYKIMDADSKTINGYYLNAKGERVTISGTSLGWSGDNWQTSETIPVGSMAEIEVTGDGYVQDKYSIEIAEGGVVQQLALQSRPEPEKLGVSYKVK
jgi:hypothetical protein